MWNFSDPTYVSIIELTIYNEVKAAVKFTIIEVGNRLSKILLLANKERVDYTQSIY